nr:pilus assembly protein PilO [Neobacillus sp. Marseille-Q6967]
MKLTLSKKQKLIILIGTLSLVLLIVIGQFLLLSPLKSDLESKEQTLATEQKLLETIGQNKDDETKKVTEDTRELQKKVPVKPLQEQFILDLEKAENVSKSKILTMGFTKDTDVTVETAQTGAEGTAAAENAENNTETTAATGDTATQDPVAQQQAASPSTGLKKLSVSLSVESPSYEDIEKFIGTLESLNRIVVVESVNYSGGEEITTLEQEKKPLTYSLTVSAYYLPTLNDLIAELPKIDAPAPANKKNPLSTTPDTTAAR